MKKILINFNNVEDRDYFIDHIKNSTDQKLKNIAENIVYDPRTITDDTSIIHAVFIDGQKIADGKFEDMSKYFKQEISRHSAKVELKILTDGNWVTVQKRASKKL